MKVIVCGAGQVGHAIARYLSTANNEVTVIDRREELVRKVEDALDVQGVVGHASLPSVLEEAGAADADMIVAVTYADEVNMIACQVAHSLFSVPMRIARVRQQDYLDKRWQDLFRRDHLPIDVVISPEVEVAQAIALSLEVPGALKVVPFAEDRVRLISVRVRPDTPIIETPLRQLTYLFPNLQIVLVGVARDDRFFIPAADDQLFAGDEVHFVVATRHLERALHTFGYEPHSSDRVVIAGGGNVGLFLALELERRRPSINLKVIEVDAERAGLVADRLKRGIVLHGDARELAILEEANAGAAEAFVAITNNDEINIMSGLLAKQLGCGRAMALLNNPSYNQILRRIDIDMAINPRETTVSRILSHVRRGRIKAVHTLRDGEAEVYEAEALETSPLVGKAISELHLARSVLIGLVVRGEEVIAPRADTVIQPGDRVILVARSDAVKRVEQLFAVRVDYF